MVNREIVGYVTEGRRRGFSVEILKRELLKSGFDAKDVEEAITEYNKSVQTKPPTQSVPVAPQTSTAEQSNLPAKVVEKKNEEIKNQTRSYAEIKSGKLGLFKKIGNSIAHPSRVFQLSRGESIWKHYLYLVVISLIPLIGIFAASLFLGAAQHNSITNFLNSKGLVGEFFAQWFTTSMDNKFIFLGILAAFFIVVYPIILLILVAILHLFVKLFNGTGKYRDSFGAVTYSMTPEYLFFFLPGINNLWKFILLIVGVSVEHGFSKVKSFFVILANILFYALIGLAIYLVNLMFV